MMGTPPSHHVTVPSRHGNPGLSSLSFPLLSEVNQGSTSSYQSIEWQNQMGGYGITI